MAGSVVVAGVGMVPFTTPSHSQTYDIMGARAVELALADAALDFRAIGQAYVAWVYGDSTSGQAALHRVGQTGLPVFNVNNYCSSGSSALLLARQAIESGAVDTALALGFEQMQRGPLSMTYTDRPTPFDRYYEVMNRIQARADAPIAAQMFGLAGQQYARRHGTRPETFARIAVKSRKHAAGNPLAVFTSPLTVEQVLASPHVHGPLTRLQCSPPTCGAAAAVLVSAEFARSKGITPAVVIRAQAMRSDLASSFTGENMMNIVGYNLAEAAARQVYETAGISPTDLRVVELHDSFTTNELIAYEALGLTPEGTAERFVVDGENTYGGRVVTNPSGGLLSRGHPLGATGLAQCAELVWQLRGRAGARQIDGVTIALQHNVGLGGATIVTLYERLS